MPALQCPDCGARHPLDDVADRAAFRCTGCGRALKVPEQLRRGAAAPPPPPRETDWGDPRRLPPPTATRTTTAYHRTAPPRSIEVVPKGVPVVVRFALWVVALPVTLWLTYRIARGIGFLTSQQVEDVFFEQHWGRFWPLARLLPLWAFLTALTVQLSVLAVERWRRRRQERRVRGDDADASDKADAARSRRRSSGSRAADSSRSRSRSRARTRGAPRAGAGSDPVDEPTRVAPAVDDARRSAG